MSFGKSLSNELGRNTGKWVSNKVFGNTGWSTPRRHVIEVEKRKKQRVEAREYKQKQQRIEQNRRERERNLKKLEKERAEKEKQEMIKANELEVREHNNYLEVIQTVHHSYSDKMNWNQVKEQPAPDYVKTADEAKNEIVQFADNEIDSKVIKLQAKYKPSLIDKALSGLYNPKNEWLFKTFGKKSIYNIGRLVSIFGILYGFAYNGIALGSFILIISAIFFFFIFIIRKGTESFGNKLKIESKINKLKNDRDKTIEKYLKQQYQAHNQYLEDIKSYKTMLDIADGVLKNKPQSFTYALNFFNPFEDLQDYGSDISFEIIDSTKVEVDFYVHSEQVIPNTSKKVLRKGIEVKEETLPQSRFNEIYQDYVCSCILKIAKETFQLIPSIKEVQVNAKGLLMNTATGKEEEQTIISTVIERNKLNQLNFELLDPSDSMSNFKNNMNFKKTQGFSPVEIL